MLLGSDFAVLNNPFKKFLLEYNYISPSIDLKWTENKIRIRNKSELKKHEIATDTNEVALEFNFIDALNEDIMKIFSSFEILNNIVGNPINKYRASYDELEGVRKKYFERLGDSLNFNNFFNLFKWFDKKISDSILQLLPTRAKFIGGEFVVESHFLERPKYQYQFPIFKTPVTIPEMDFSRRNIEIPANYNVGLSSSVRYTAALLNSENQLTLQSNVGTTYTATVEDNKWNKNRSTNKVRIDQNNSILVIEGELMKT